MNLNIRSLVKSITPSKPFKCVIIDDDVTVRTIISAKLTMSDQYEVHMAADGDEGLDLVHKVSPNFVLLDWMMPNKSGLEVLKEIRAHWSLSHIPVFMLTARGQMSDMEEALAAGATGYFTKPIKLDELCKRVRLALDKT
ncbi:MAG: response regulator [Magnetovibrio sp.]|nr:response regulator [Magnetovibrio sp.]